jgi:ABC-type transport system substrate-binding protein
MNAPFWSEGTLSPGGHRQNGCGSTRPVNLAALLVALSILILAGCGPADQSVSQRDGSSTAPSAPKVLRLGIITDAEPKEGGVVYGGGAGGSEPKYIFHAGLTVFDDSAQLQPRAAEGVPTVENGAWKILPDGRMEVTWRLRPDVVWHDGSPLTADDFLLGLKFGADQDLKFTRGGAVVRQIETAAAPDPHTLVMTWKNVYIYANAIGVDVLPPLHRQFAELHASADPDAVAASPYWAEEWIGIGPYRMREWSRGSQMEGEAFDNTSSESPSSTESSFASWATPTRSSSRRPPVTSTSFPWGQ